MRFGSRSGELSPREGLAMAYELFADGRPADAAMMFLAYADQDNDIGIVSESEFNALAEHLKEVLAYAALFNMILERQVQPVLTDDMTPGYKASPWALES